MGSWLVDISLIRGIVIGVDIDILTEKAFSIEIYIGCIKVTIWFADFAYGVCIFGHHVTKEGFTAWLRKLKEIPTNS